MKIQLNNDFHNTTTSVIVNESMQLSARQVKRAKRALCVTGCSCSNGLGIRGPQHIDSEYYVEFIDNYDGSGRLELVPKKGW